MGLKNFSGHVVQAPMAGGAATSELVTAVGATGALGFLAAGYVRPDRLAEQIAVVRESGVPFGVNVFVPGVDRSDPVALTAYSERLLPTARKLDTELGDPFWTDDDYEAKLDLLVAVGVPVVTFTFGCPAPEDVLALQESGSEVGVTVTSPQEAVEAERAGADFVIAQGVEAGGHRGGWLGGEQFGVLSLIRLVSSVSDLRIVAAGGITDGAGVRAVLAAGAIAASAGTAFLRCPESGASATHQDALVAPEFADTELTCAFTGRPARALTNGFIREHGPYAPASYPQVHQLTRPLRAAAAAAGDPDGMAMWAGQSHALARAVPAAEVVAELLP